MNIDHMVTALERADAIAAEQAIPEFLQLNGVDPYRFVADVVPELKRQLASHDNSEQVAMWVAAEFLRGVVVGILAARIEVEGAA